MKCNTDHYQSPSFYCFSEDSIILAKVAMADCEKNNKQGNVLDLGAGAGVVGIEFIKGATSFQNWRLTCCEKQNEFLSYLENNLSEHKIRADVHMISFQNLKVINTFDVILFNPPYFYEKKGRPAKNINRHQCRFFADDFFSDLEVFVDKYLSNDGFFYFLYRSDQVEPIKYFSALKYQINHLGKFEDFLNLVRVLKL